MNSNPVLAQSLNHFLLPRLSVDLKTVGHAPRALFVDLSPPIAGNIYHGNQHGYRRLYQWENDSLCVMWEGFHDPESGISMIMSYL